MKQNKTHIEGMRLMAEVAARTGVFEDAEFLLETVVELQPDHMDAELQLIHILLRRQRFHKAYERTKALCQKHNNPPQQALALSASACFGVGENTEAIQIYEQMIKASPHDPALKVSLAHIYNAIGSTDHAITLFKEAYQLNTNFGDAYWSLANTKSYRFSEEEITAMTESITSERPPQLDQIQMHFALGKAYEDQQKFERSFDHYAKGNALKQKTSNHSAEQLDIRVSTQIDVCTKDLFEQRSGVGHTAQDPIFIVGLPRAGSTLLEQILASHSMVDGTMELHDILDLAKRLRGRDKASDPSPRYPRILQELGADKFTQFGKQFISDTRAYRGSAPRFIDKMPNNFFHVGLIKLILPRAKIIDARRHPMSCCFSGLKQLFGEGQEFSYGQEEIGNYYKQYVRLMNHWDEVLPGFVLRVQHEEVVEDLDKQVRRLLDFCELPFEEGCLNFHKTERSVRTPSAEQVRQPIYRSGLDQWRNFEQFLNPLKHALGAEILDDYGITPPQ
jgi:tetratricopeptide (TPR) repeat protein